jgi:uric acid-xanthine permease
MSMAVGAGVTIWPFAFQDMRASSYTANFWRCDTCSPTMQGLRNGVAIFLSTGYCVGTIVAMLLNFILPNDGEIIRNQSASIPDDADAPKDLTANVVHENDPVVVDEQYGA